ncbi:hypothetical protein G6F56_009082 [Rhizopus delemar]|nr:hypothetical protein G6F56_009082 [Rhizopus delemar]
MISEEEAIVPQRTEEYETSIFEQEFTEEDVLPFLLQAQDIISKLESRVVELEKDLSDQYINHLISKVSKVEFNSKETIVLLSELNTEDDQINSTIHLCLQYLRQAQNTKEDDLEEGEIERRRAAVAEWSQQHIPEHSSVHTEEPLDIMDGLSSCNSSHIAYSKPSVYIQSIAPQEHNQCCMNCKQLLAQLDDQIEQKAYLKRDLGSLAAALSEQQDIRFTIEQDKEALELDVGDITTTLFSALNQILMDDVTERDGIVQLNREMSGQLNNVLDSWDTRESRLKQMKESLVQLDSAVHQSSNISPTFARRFSHPHASPIPSLISVSKRPLSHRQSLSNHNNIIQIDGHLLSEFQHHLKTVAETKTPIPSTAFVKRVFTEDIEPCLFAQPSQQGWWKSGWFKKKLLDAISKNTCEIQYWNGTCHTSYMSTTTNSSSSLTSSAASHLSYVSSGPSPPKTKCVCCNILRVCEFRMNTSPTTRSPWLPIDRFCRDKIVSVCGYYSFMNNLKMLSTTMLNAFKQVMFHRRRMAIARIGSMSLFEDMDEFLDEKRQKRLSHRQSLVLDHSGSNSDSGSVVSISELQGLEGASQVVIVH